MREIRTSGSEGGAGRKPRSYLYRHVAARLRPQAVRAASRSASQEQPMLGECAEFGARCIRFCMGAAARGTLSRPAAGRRSYAS